jgi:hypothetical protein
VCTPCGYGEDAREAAAAIASAAAHSVGRTLFIAPREDDGRDILPDAFIPGLFHNNIGIPELVIPTASERPLLPSHAPDGQPFRIIVLAVSSPDRAGAAIAGGGGAGAVLVVHEDKTTLASIRRTQADLQAAGGTVWGTILAKAIRPAAQSARRSWWH